MGLILIIRTQILYCLNVCRPDLENVSGGASRNPLMNKKGKVSQPRAGVGAFFRDRAAALTHSHWQVRA